MNTLKKLSLIDYGDASFEFTLDNYAYTSGDYVKLFLLDDMESLVPLCAALELAV